MFYVDNFNCEWCTSVILNFEPPSFQCLVTMELNSHCIETWFKEKRFQRFSTKLSQQSLGVFWAIIYDQTVILASPKGRRLNLLNNWFKLFLVYQLKTGIVKLTHNTFTEMWILSSSATERVQLQFRLAWYSMKLSSLKRGTRKPLWKFSSLLPQFPEALSSISGILKRRLVLFLPPASIFEALLFFDLLQQLLWQKVG